MSTASPKQKHELPSERATKIVKERQAQYGHAADVYRTAAQFWMVYLAGRKKVVVDLDAEDVAHFQLLLKEAREITAPGHIDNLDDIAGYANVLDLIQQRRADADPD